MIDLHTHTNYSDGTWKLTKLLEEAEKAKIKILSITDHDTLKAYKELENIDYKSIFKGKIIPGIELNTVYDGVKFELLAYDFDYTKLNEWVHEKYETRKPDLNKEFEYMINSCKKNNIKIGDIKFDKNIEWPIDVIYPEIKKYDENKKYFTNEEWEDIDKFFNSCVTNKNFPVFVDCSIHYPNALEVAEKIKDAGGKVFVAHVFRYKLKDTKSFLDILRENKIIDGIEVYHSSFTEEQSKYLKEYCKTNKLLMSGGSDCHGNKRADRKIGIGYGNMNIDENLLDNWNFIK